MSTIPKNPQSKISANASDLLDCFVTGLDEVVYEVAEQIARHRLSPAIKPCEPAEQIARHRLSPAIKPCEPIEINESDVREAGDIVIKSLREQIVKNKISPEVGQLLDQVAECFETRTAKVR